MSTLLYIFHAHHGLHEFVSYFAKKSKKNQKESNNQWCTCDQWDLLPNQHQKMHGEQEETEQSKKDYGKEYPLGFKKCAEQQHSELIIEQTDTGSPGEQHKKCLNE